MPDAADDPLDALRERLRTTQEAAERLARSSVPPAGWEAPRDGTGEFTEEVRALATLLEAVRDLLPADLREQVTELVRQLLLVLRSIIDLWVARMEDGPRGAEPVVEDIPIA